MKRGIWSKGLWSCWTHELMNSADYFHSCAEESSGSAAPAHFLYAGYCEER